MNRRAWAFLFLCAFAVSGNAFAGETTAGISLGGAHGQHREADGSATAPFVPAPIFNLSHRAGRFEVALRALPPVGVAIAGNDLGMRHFDLSYGDATLRLWNRNGTLAVGLGETLYNQHTQFLQAQAPGQQWYDVNRSRVAGARYEVDGRFSLLGGNAIEADLGIDPAMHGTYVNEQQFVQNGVTKVDFTFPPNWERASQIDADVRFVHPMRGLDVAYGVRYVNYTAEFTGGRFADANAVVMPYIAIQRRWGSAAGSP